MRAAVVIPIHNDLDACRRVLSDIESVADGISHQLEIVIVDDGSNNPPIRPDSFGPCRLRGTLISLVRNVGQQRAATIGLCHVAKREDLDAVVLMDGDGEDRPADIPQLLDLVEEGDATVVVASRRRRQVGIRFRFFYFFYKLMFRLLTGRWIDFGNFSAMHIDAVRRLAYLDSLWLHTAASALMSREPLKRVKCDRGARHLGKSNFSFAMHVTYGLRAIAVFNEILLARIVVLSGAICAAALAAVLFAVSLKLSGLATPNWVTVVLVSMAVFTVQAIILCILGVQIASANRSASTRPPIAFADQYIAEIRQFSA